MTTIEAQVPDYLAREAAAKENVSVDQIVALALASQVSAWGVRDEMTTRAARGKLVDFDLIISKVPEVPPQPGDELPPGYVSPISEMRGFLRGMDTTIEREPDRMSAPRMSWIQL